VGGDQHSILHTPFFFSGDGACTVHCVQVVCCKWILQVYIMDVSISSASSASASLQSIFQFISEGPKQGLRRFLNAHGSHASSLLPYQRMVYALLSSLDITPDDLIQWLDGLMFGLEPHEFLESLKAKQKRSPLINAAPVGWILHAFNACAVTKHPIIKATWSL